MDKIPSDALNSIYELIKELNNNNLQIQKAYLFGSYSNNSYTEFSDIDIALISNSFTGNRFLDKEMIRKFVVKINTDLSPLPFNPVDFNNNNIMASEILKTGIEISL